MPSRLVGWSYFSWCLGLTGGRVVSASQAVTMIIDSVDTMATDTDSDSVTLQLLHDLTETIKSRKAPGRLVLSITSTSSLLPHLLTPTFSQALTHARLYDPSLLLHMHRVFLLAPPPLTPVPKFYSVFTPFVHRARRETESLVFGAEVSTVGSVEGETVVEVTVRSSGSKRTGGVERALEGWKLSSGPCTLEQLESLVSCFQTVQGVTIQKAAQDPTQNLSFNLNLTVEQQASRAQVPLPYAHTGEGSVSTASAPTIYYDPDSADDFDDEDPDEDLDL
ncbi:hypothetical protein M408DRAFT_253234 [Serendipita vermifera MAFF 305830]|uniref:Elongator complex protein 5 n=1 Tax=Serendipita vermifera MAFF 305830 TaxID=933852 RepID=A0A0C3AWB5_SERVB|nr:hypothetical protein M408DRAFT_253234 [Serendipita vermifera MAFF 305830]